MLQATTFTPASRAPVGGSSNIQFKFTEEQHSAWLAATGQTGTAAAGWYRILRDLQGGRITLDRDAEPLHNEAGEYLGDRQSRDDVVIANSVMGTDAITIKTLQFLERTSVPVRYPLPLEQDGTFRVEDGDLYGQLWVFPQVRARKTNRQIETGRENQRAMEFELVATKPSSQARAWDVHDVNLSDEGEWPSALDAFKTPGA